MLGIILSLFVCRICVYSVGGQLEIDFSFYSMQLELVEDSLCNVDFRQFCLSILWVDLFLQYNLWAISDDQYGDLECCRSIQIVRDQQ